MNLTVTFNDSGSGATLRSTASIIAEANLGVTEGRAADIRAMCHSIRGGGGGDG